MDRKRVLAPSGEAGKTRKTRLPARKAPGRAALPSAAVALLLAAAGALAAPAAAAPALTLHDDGVVVSGLAPSGRAVLFGAARIDRPYHQALRFYREILADEDGDGVVRFVPPGEGAGGEAPEGEVPRKSFWVAVDLATGEVAAAAPEGYPLRLGPLPSGALDAGPEGGSTLRLRELWIELVLLRPGEEGAAAGEEAAAGVWRGRVADGGAGDADGAVDTYTTVDLTALEPLAAEGPAAPAELREGDVLVVLAPHRMELITHRLAGARPGAAGASGGSRP